MKKINKFIRYIFWCGGHINYKHFGEEGHTGITLIVLNIVLLVGNFFSFIRVWLYGHLKLFTTEKFDFFVKILIAIFILALYSIFERKLNNTGIKKNTEFNHISRSIRVRDTFFILFFLFFQFYIFFVIMSPSFNL